MDVYIIRHAAAEEQDARRWPDDSERPLTDSGRKKFRRLAHQLGEVVDTKPIVFSSRFVRAWETAGILADGAGWPKPKECEALEFQDNTQVISVLRDHAKEKAIALVGHEPQLGRLISLLLTGDEDRVRTSFKKGAAAFLTVPISLPPGESVLNWIITPGLMEK
jgi:phosphohistidine phosphatase